MTDWKSCENCKDQECYKFMTERKIVTEEICDDWKPIPCKRCGGALSEIREHNGKKYRHCYSCLMDYEV